MLIKIRDKWWENLTPMIFGLIGLILVVLLYLLERYSIRDLVENKKLFEYLYTNIRSLIYSNILFVIQIRWKLQTLFTLDCLSKQ